MKHGLCSKERKILINQKLAEYFVKVNSKVFWYTATYKAIIQGLSIFLRQNQALPGTQDTLELTMQLKNFKKHAHLYNLINIYKVSHEKDDQTKSWYKSLEKIKKKLLRQAEIILKSEAC